MFTVGLVFWRCLGDLGVRRNANGLRRGRLARLGRIRDSGQFQLQPRRRFFFQLTDEGKMEEITFVEFVWVFTGLLTAFAVLVVGTTAHQNKVLRAEVLRLIEAGTNEHKEFRQELKQHDALFRGISEKLGEIGGKVDLLISLQQKPTP